jgi:hypothetical protein
MRKVWIAVLTMAFAAGMAMAAEGGATAPAVKKDGACGGGGCKCRGGDGLPGFMLKAFDKDGDGKLSDTEKAEMMKKCDTNGDGKLDRAEKMAMKGDQKAGCGGCGKKSDQKAGCGGCAEKGDAAGKADAPPKT